MSAFDPRRFGKSARNEQRKLLATTFNTAGLAVFGIGFLTPIFSFVPVTAEPVKLALACAIFALLHMGAQRVLRDVEE